MENQTPQSQATTQAVPQQMYKNPGLAAILSFFWMGLGQIYNGHIGKGIGFIIAYVISWILMLAIVGFVTTPILFVWGIVDAYKSAERINLELANRH
jgi:TM2 domain-containing membrane protein YozV